MAKRELLLTFPFQGVGYKVYLVPKSHPELYDESSKLKGKDNPGLWGCCLYDDGIIYLSETMCEEARRSVLIHEVQHLVEQFMPLDHAFAAAGDVASDMRTDLISKGWLYIIRHCPELLDYLQRKR